MAETRDTPQETQAPEVDAFTAWEAQTSVQQLGQILTVFPPPDWLKEPALAVLAAFRPDALQWARVCVRWQELAPFLSVKLLEQAIDHWRTEMGEAPLARARGRPRQERVPQLPALPEGDWQQQLLCTVSGEPKQCLSNVRLLLAHASPWQETFWLDSVRGQPMVGERAVDDRFILHVCQWLGEQARMVVTTTKMVGSVVVALCEEQPRDLLQEWLAGLPPWDGTRRLTSWVHELAGGGTDVCDQEIARQLVVSMVARALDPGCQYRYVVLLEGAENTGKSKLVRTLASPEWCYECVIGLEGKEAYMALQGAWLVELPELNAMTRTEESHFKGLVTQVSDSWIPKFANHKITHKRRTIFVGTLNPEGTCEYLRGQTGNTRYLPLPTGAIDTAGLLAVRAQLFAEALDYYRRFPDDWWQLSAEAEQELVERREDRRERSVYQDLLSDFLSREGATLTSWQEIAERVLQLQPWQWKDKGLQKQIAQALVALGWESRTMRVEGKVRKCWVKRPPLLPGLYLPAANQS
jgi:putative DNA primase/helicase